MRTSKSKRIRYTLLVFREHEVMGEYVAWAKDRSDDAIKEIAAKLKPGLSAVILGDHGLVCHTANLPKTNPWYREFCLHI